MTNIEGIILAHFSSQLLTDPVSHLWHTLLVQPTEPLDFFDDPFLLALFGEDPAQPYVIGGSPQGEVEKEESFGRRARQDKEKQNLEAEQRKIGQVEVRLRVSWIKQSQHVVRSRYAKN